MSSKEVARAEVAQPDSAKSVEMLRIEALENMVERLKQALVEMAQQHIVLRKHVLGRDA